MSERQDFNPDFINVDPLRQSYRKSFVERPDRTESIEMHNAALLCIDMQYLDAAPGYGVFANGRQSGVPIEAQEYYFSSLKNTVLPNVRLLQDCFRQKNLEVIHFRIQSLTRDGRDRGPGHKYLNLHAPPGSKEAEFLPEIAPADDEIIVNKTASGVFTSTNTHYILRNLNIDSLYITGVYTNECVSTTVRDARDLGFLVTLVEDGCTTVTEQLHEFTVTTLRDRYARVAKTSDVIREIENRLPDESRPGSPAEAGGGAGRV